MGTIIAGLLMLVFAYGAWTLKPWTWMVGVICQVLSLLTVLSNLSAGAAFGTQITSIAITHLILYYLFLETLWQGIGDSLFGFRVYPVESLRHIMTSHHWMRRFDFDPEAAVRLVWRGHRPINIAAPVKYLRAEEGGVSHFNYLRDNTLLTSMHIRLLAGFLLRLPLLLWRRVSSRQQ